MKLSISLVVAATVLNLLPAVVMGVGVTISFNQNRDDANKKCTEQEWNFVTSTLQALANTRVRRALRGEEADEVDQGERELNKCGRWCVFIPRNRFRRDQESSSAADAEQQTSKVHGNHEDAHARQLNWQDNECSEAKNLVINTLNSQVMPQLSYQSPHLCRNLIQSQHDLSCF